MSASEHADNSDTPDGSVEQPRRRTRRHRRVVRPGTESGTVSGLSADELPDTWAEESSSPTAQDYKRDRPPHWRN